MVDGRWCMVDGPWSMVHSLLQWSSSLSCLKDELDESMVHSP
jgi:hypothetical protein